MSNFEVIKQEDGRWRYASMVFDTETEAKAYEARWLRARSDGRAAKVADQTSPTVARQEVSVLNVNPLKLAALAAAFVALGAALYVGSRISTANEEFRPAAALSICQSALKIASIDPEKAEIPAVQDFGSSSEYSFSWGASTRMARMRNGLGFDVPVSAACIVNKATRKITVLSLNGETLI